MSVDVVLFVDGFVEKSHIVYIIETGFESLLLIRQMECAVGNVQSSSSVELLFPLRPLVRIGGGGRYVLGCSMRNSELAFNTNFK